MIPRPLLWLTALAIVQTCMTQSICAVETNAVIPYKTLDNMFQPIAAIDTNRIEVHVFVVSANKAVHATNITLTIRSATKGTIPLLLNTNGQILKFPLDKELRRENPPIIANQPKGSLWISVGMQIPPLDDLTFRYSRLGDGVAEMNKSIKAQAGMVLSLFAPRVEGVAFLFPKASAGKAKVEIMSVTGKKEYTADKNGVVKLKLDKALLSENPDVKVSEKPNHIVPDMSAN